VTSITTFKDEAEALEIANELGVTEGTVKVYLHGVFEKLGVSSRTELAVRADEFLGEHHPRP